MKITASALDLVGHPGTPWDSAHIHLGNARIHVAVVEEAIKWITQQIK